MLPTIKRRSYVPNYRNHFYNNDLFSTLFSDGADYNVPAVNIKENEKSFEIEIAAPGLNKEDIVIKLEKDVLTISSEKENKEEKKDEVFTRKEFSFNSFSRSFSIPEVVDSEKIKATHKNGILNVLLPKMEEKVANKSKTIKIS